MDGSSCSPAEDPGTSGKGRKKGRRPKYTVIDLSVSDDGKDCHDKDSKQNISSENSGSQDHTEKGSDVEEKKDEMDDTWHDELDVEEDAEERHCDKRDKDQEYNMFVKSHRKRGHCTTKKSKRPRSDSL
eukprot:TRINITY_DN15654_c0_g1_i1.p1 TRINITY_DN15654_c0_g1~~TRINITY_DN15654_c0_g1_i1.p1  ORF type:complete len:140 (-),score=60.30 TRINITY_DN15654_c0_g1_i1:31-417(-)